MKKIKLTEQEVKNTMLALVALILLTSYAYLTLPEAETCKYYFKGKQEYLEGNCSALAILHDERVNGRMVVNLTSTVQKTVDTFCEPCKIQTIHVRNCSKCCPTTTTTRPTTTTPCPTCQVCEQRPECPAEKTYTGLSEKSQKEMLNVKPSRSSTSGAYVKGCYDCMMQAWEIADIPLCPKETNKTILCRPRYDPTPKTYQSFDYKRYMQIEDKGIDYWDDLERYIRGGALNVSNYTEISPYPSNES